MELTGIFRDPLTRVKHQLNQSLETNYFATTVVGELTYDKEHAHCKGVNANIGREHMSSLFVTENLEVTVKTVTVREMFDNWDIMVIENGAYIPATLRQGRGVLADFGTLLLKQRQVPSRWRRVRDINAVRLERSQEGGSVLVDDNQQVHFTTYGPAPVAPNCPTNYWWTNTGDPKVIVARKVATTPGRKESFHDIPTSETLPTASSDIQLD